MRYEVVADYGDVEIRSRFPSVKVAEPFFKHVVSVAGHRQWSGDIQVVDLETSTVVMNWSSEGA